MLLPDPVLDERFEDLVAELRDARVASPQTLVDRVEELVSRPAPSPPRRAVVRTRLRRRPRLAVGRAVAGIGALAGIGLVVWGFSSLGGGSGSYGSAGSTAAEYAMTVASGAASGPEAAAPSPPASVAESDSGTGKAAALGVAAAPDGTVAQDAPALGTPDRLQHESAALEIALPSVAAVSRATGDVTRAVQGYSGYVVAVSFDAETTGRGSVVAKVPIGRMQEAIGRFSALGAVTAEHVDLTDLQKRADSLEQRLATVRLRIARLQGQIATPGIGQADLLVARARLAQARLDLANLHHAAQATASEAAMADLSVALVSRVAPKVVAPPAHRSAIARSALDALGVLGVVGRVVVYVLILGSPLVVLALLGALVRRRLRLRRERRLLESA